MQPLKASLVSCCPSWKTEVQAGLRLSDLPKTRPVHREAQWSELWTPSPVLSTHSGHYTLSLWQAGLMALAARQRAPVWPPLSTSSGPRLFQLFAWLQHHLPTQPARNERVIFCCPLPASQQDGHSPHLPPDAFHICPSSPTIRSGLAALCAVAVAFTLLSTAL